MKIIVAVCVFDRINNIKTWLSCWKVCNQQNAELVIVHNHYNDLVLKEKFETLCKENNILYVGCNRPGFDVGRFQDICRQRLIGFPDYDYLLWCTDDTLPMQKDFISPFINSFNNPKVGVSAMEISPSVAMHTRTTGFCIKKEVAGKLTFPADPITTKQHCYLFEHRDRKKTFYDQIVSMGLIPVQVAPAKTSPLWDTGYWRRLDRQKEHDSMFNPGKITGDKVLFICPIFNMYPAIISSLICQTHQNWELLLIHNGPEVNGLDAIVKGYNDKRIKFIINPVQTGKWGHPLRQWALKQNLDADYIVITNCDNYHVPVYTEYMLAGFKKSHTAVATYCTEMTHSYKAWQVIPCSLKLGFIDCCGVMVKKDVACEIGWRDVDGHSSDWTYFSDIAAKYSTRNFIPVRGNLIVHN